MPHIDNLIYNFSQKNLIQYLRSKIDTFKPDDDDLSYLFKDELFEKYESIDKIGEATIGNDDLIIIASKTSDPLTEKSGKKKQYEIAKKILKEELKDAALFIFYDDEGNFRFSFVKANYLGTKRNFTDFKRYSYFVTPHKANNTFKRQVDSCNFSSLDEIIKAFSVEPLNKLFYQEVSKAFYKLIGGEITIASKKYNFKAVLELPSTPLANRKIYQEFGVRLIGRTIFCWFLKNKKSEAKKPLIPENWLSSDTVDLLSNGGYNYYHDYLEKLFFLILNKKQDERKDYELPDGQEDIPFLNGGLFEPHHDDFFPKDSNGIHKISYNLKIPNDWFFEFFKVLEQFNFTIDENSINDAEVSIDPEMLGTIFENLLAEIDPDTEKSARNATGSFYTPREIVDYMVEQSFIQYLKTKTNVENEVSLQNLFKEGGENDFSENQTLEILEALNSVKILDPACGSGAFPMGALHKIITILHKLDPDASWWKEKQINSNSNALIRRAVKEELDKKNADYIRKLGVIQNSIYGVDIQPIATEIAKLRSFLSLIIDENIIDDADNRGIEPLPNLEFKFVTANTLIGLPDEGGQQGMFDNFAELQLLEQLRVDYLQSSGKKKIDIKERFLRVQKKAFVSQNNLFADTNSRAYKIMSWNPFSDEASTWFDPKWMYGVQEFDIVIGNPPYSVFQGKSINELIPIMKDKIYEKAKGGKINAYELFLCKAPTLLSTDGISCQIFQNSFLADNSSAGVRIFYLNEQYIYRIDSFPERDDPKKRVFEKVKMSVCILLSKNSKKSDYNFEVNFWNDKHKSSGKSIIYNNKSIMQFNPDYGIIYNLNVDEKCIFEKYFIDNKHKYSDFYSCMEGELNMTFHKGYLNSDNNNPLVVKGAQVQRYFVTDSPSQGEVQYVDKANYMHDYIKSPKSRHHKKSRIAMQGITGANDKIRIISTLLESDVFLANSCNYIFSNSDNSKYSIKLLLGIFNSSFTNWIFRRSSTNSNVNCYEVNNLKLPRYDSVLFQKIEILVSKILNDIKSNNQDIINILVFKLYNLNYEEILIVTPEFNLTKEQYENYKID